MADALLRTPEGAGGPARPSGDTHAPPDEITVLDSLLADAEPVPSPSSAVEITEISPSGFATPLERPWLLLGTLVLLGALTALVWLRLAS